MPEFSFGSAGAGTEGLEISGEGGIATASPNPRSRTVNIFPLKVEEVSGTWTTPGNIAVEDGSVAAATTAATIVSLNTRRFQVLPTVPPGSTIESVKVAYKRKVDSTEGNPLFGVLVKTDNLNTDGEWHEAAGATTSLAETTVDFTALYEWQTKKALDNSIVVSLRNRNNGGKTTTFSWDSVCLRITYTPPRPGARILVFNDTSESTEPLTLYGSFDAFSAERLTLQATGGDTRPTAMGVAQGNTKTRQIECKDNDFFGGDETTERAEAGRNESKFGANGNSGTAGLFYEGEHWEIWQSINPKQIEMASVQFRALMQLKVAQPIKNEGHTSPIYEQSIREGKWKAFGGRSEGLAYWEAAATEGRMTRFKTDVFFHSDPTKGYIQVYMDDRSGEPTDVVWTYVSPLVHLQTIDKETEAGGEYAIGEAAPTHFRTGIYRKALINGTEIMLTDNTQFVRVL